MTATSVSQHEQLLALLPRPPPANLLSQIRLISSDVDGTLLASNHKLTERVKASVSRLPPHVRLILCTGKTRFAVRDILAELGLKSPSINLNGLIAFDEEDRCLFDHRMHGPSAATVLEFAMKLGHTCVVYSYDSVWCNVINDKTDDLLNYHEPPVQIWKGGNNENGSDCQNSNDIITAVRNGNLLAHKLIICIDPKDMDVLKEKVMNDPTLAPLLSKDSALESGIDFCYPLPKFLEFGPSGYNKQTALARLCKMMGYSQHEVLALGDGDNDKEMLGWAGVGVAMGNAMESARVTAKYSTLRNDEDGFAVIMENIISASQEYHASI